MSHQFLSLVIQPLPQTIDLSPFFLLSLKFLKGLCTPGYLHSFTLTTYCPPVGPRSSTQEALLSVTRNWFQLLSKHHQVACVFFDVKKAFDSVLHRKIISSLSDIGIKGSLLKWLRDYLSGRCQRVVLDGTTSDPVNVTSGVPQGWILSPLLFNIVMNSVSKLPQSRNASLILYADNVLLFKPIDSTSDVKSLQHNVEKVINWMSSQGQTPNHTKTQLLLHQTPSHQDHHQRPPIAPASSVKYLGVTISSNLSWSDYIASTCKKANAS